MDNQDSSTGCVVPRGGSGREPERSSDSSTLGLELSSRLEPPPKPKGFSLKKSSLQLIELQLMGKVSVIQQKTEAGIRTLESTQAPEHAKMACFFVSSYLWWLRRGTFTVAGSFGSGCSNPVWATTTEIRTSCGSDFNPKRLPA